MSAFIQVHEKGAKKAKKMDIAQTKTDIYKQQASALRATFAGKICKKNK